MKLNDLLKTSGNDSDLIFNDKHRAIKNYRLMQWAKWATFGLYIVAVFMLYVADVWGIGSFIEQKSNDWVALIVFSAIAFVLAFFLASSKEAVYEDIALHRAEGYKLKTSQIVAMGLFLTSGLLFEMFSTSNNQQHIANSAAEGSSMMKEVTGSNVTLSTGSAALTQDLQAAQMRLADCKVRMEKALAKGKAYDCAQSEANVAAVRESMQMANAMANDTNAAALNAKTDAMLKVREHFDKPMFKEIGKVAGTDNNGGMLIVIGVLIFIFECQHIMALFAYANALRRIKSKGGNVAQDQPRSNITPPLSAIDSAKMSVAEYAQKVEAGLKSSPEVIATEYARAQHAREQMAAMTGDKLQAVGNKIEAAINPQVGFLKLLIAENQARVNHGMEATHENVRNTIAHVLKRHQQTTGNDTSHADVNKLADLVMKHLKPSKPEIIETDGFKQSPEQLATVQRLYQEQMREYEAGKVFNEFPTPPINQLSIAETIRELVGAVKKSGAKTEADIQVAVFNGYQKLFNPADLDDGDLLKVAAKIAKSSAPATPTPTIPRTIPDTTKRDSEITTKRDSGIVGQRDSQDTLYDQWKAAVVAGELSTACGKFYKFARDNGDFTGIANRELDVMWNEFGERGVKEGCLLNNPDFVQGSTKPKYILSPTYKNVA